MTETKVLNQQYATTAVLDDKNRPRFHFLPRQNWMNDPNGLIQWKGQYHLFYQHNPYGAFHANMHWGHAASPDLVHWEHLPIALAPTPGGTDKDGVYSGCAVNHMGVPTLIYTGIAPEVQCVAVGSDDLLSWEKRAEPIIAAPPQGLELFGFRDPCVWKDGNRWYMAVGAGIKGVGGAVLLYQSADLIQWDYIGPLLVDGSNQPNKVWECPAFFPLEDKYVLIVSITSRASVEYFIGTFDGRSFYPEVRRKLDGGRYFYAPQTFLDEQGRRVLMGWIWEGRSEAKDVEAGWSGIQSVPRILSLHPGGYLGIAPIPELQQLRGAHHHYDNLSSSLHSIYRTDIQNNQLEIKLRCQLSETGEVGVVLAQSPGDEEQTRIVFNWDRGALWIDRRFSNAVGDVDLDTLIAPLTLNGENELNLHLYYDHSVIEVFANERVCLTSRIYPMRSDSLGLSFFASGAAQLSSVDVWEINSIW